MEPIDQPPVICGDLRVGTAAAETFDQVDGVAFNEGGARGLDATVHLHLVAHSNGKYEVRVAGSHNEGSRTCLSGVQIDGRTDCRNVCKGDGHLVGLGLRVAPKG